jgi:hypothetical protein
MLRFQVKERDFPNQTSVCKVERSGTLWILHLAMNTFPTAKVGALIPRHLGLLWIEDDCILELKQWQSVYLTANNEPQDKLHDCSNLHFWLTFFVEELDYMQTQKTKAFLDSQFQMLANIHLCHVKYL